MKINLIMLNKILIQSKVDYVKQNFVLNVAFCDVLTIARLMKSSHRSVLWCGRTNNQLINLKID